MPMKTNIPEHLPPGVAYTSSGNSCTENYSFIGNGRLNCANGSASFIGNGAINQVDAGTNNSFIGNGARHQIVGGAHNSFVGSGDCNIIQSLSANSVIGGGEQNTIGNAAVGSLDAQYSFVGGGFGNTIDTGTTPGTESRLNVIGGGLNNLICAGACNSAIIGGEGNIVTHNWATVAGFNVSSQADCAFTTNCVIACNTPIFGSPVPVGAFMYVVAPAILGFPVGTCMVLIQ